MTKFEKFRQHFQEKRIIFPENETCSFLRHSAFDRDSTKIKKQKKFLAIFKYEAKIFKKKTKRIIQNEIINNDHHMKKHSSFFVVF